MRKKAEERKQPEETPWFKFYIADSLWCIRDWLAETLRRIYNSIIGGWYCEYCNKVHCRRVAKYRLCNIHNSCDYITTCSLGYDAYKEGTWEQVSDVRSVYCDNYNAL